MPKSIWILSAYRSDSHAYWVDWLVSHFKEFQWHKLELPGRHFRWRIRGNPLSWLDKLPETSPDLILATSMVDLATLKGLHPRLADIPCIYYFHENQFAYPVSEQQYDSIEPKMVQVYGAIAADKVVFNSAYNRDSCIHGVEKLLRRFPDNVPDSVVTMIQEKSTILPVVIKPVNGIIENTEKNNNRGKSTKLILWNHRWEYDKAPEIFADALECLVEKTPDFQLALLGQRPKQKHRALLAIEKIHGDRIIVNGKVSDIEYRQFLAQADIVVSTAIHEFQGLSILEAVSADCVPVVPDDLCYKEQFSELYRYRPGDSQSLADCISAFLENPPQSPDVSFWYSEAIIDDWKKLLKCYGS